MFFPGIISPDRIAALLKSMMLAVNAADQFWHKGLAPLPRPRLHRAGLRALLRRRRAEFFRSLDEDRGVPATRTSAGKPALRNRAERRRLARQVRFAPAV